jgi:hypothetical protein
MKLGDLILEGALKHPSAQVRSSATVSGSGHPRIISFGA